MRSDCCSRRRQHGLASTWIFGGFALVALFFLVTEHRAHLYGVLPYLLLAACPLMHLFHGHGGHGRHGSDDAPPRRDQPRRPAGPGPSDPAAHHHH